MNLTTKSAESRIVLTAVVTFLPPQKGATMSTGEISSMGKNIKSVHDEDNFQKNKNMTTSRTFFRSVVLTVDLISL